MKLDIEAEIRVDFPESDSTADFTEVSFIFDNQAFSANLLDVIKYEVVFGDCREQAVFALRKMLEQIEKL